MVGSEMDAWTERKAPTPTPRPRPISWEETNEQKRNDYEGGGLRRFFSFFFCHYIIVRIFALMFIFMFINKIGTRTLFLSGLEEYSTRSTFFLGVCEVARQSHSFVWWQPFASMEVALTIVGLGCLGQGRMKDEGWSPSWTIYWWSDGLALAFDNKQSIKTGFNA